MKALGPWTSPILAGIMAFVGLLASSRAADSAFEVGAAADLHRRGVGIDAV